MIAFIGWSTFSVRAAFDEYIFPRSERIAISQEAATWLANNTPPTVRVGFDRRVFKGESPTWGMMGFHYQALVFGIYPREFGFARDDAGLQDYDYLFSSRTRNPMPDLPVAWNNKYYVLYQVVPDAKVYSPLVPKPLRTPAARDLIDTEEQEQAARRSAGLPVYKEEDVLDLRGLSDNCCTHHFDLSKIAVEPREVWQDNNRLTMAFKSSTGTLPLLVYRSGAHFLVIRATGEGCESDPPRLTVAYENGPTLAYQIEPDRTSCYVVSLPTDPVEARIQLVFTNDGLCDESVDKNIFIESIEFMPAIDDTTQAQALIAP